MKVLITGGAGFIGSHTAEAFRGRGHQVLIIDNLSRGNVQCIPNFYPAHFVQEDIRYRERFGWAVQKFKPDVICHLAAQSSLRESLIDPLGDILTNVGGTQVMINVAKTYGCHLIFASTGAVYADSADFGGRPMSESGPFQPLTPYAVSKYSAEHYIEISEVPSTILRYSNVYGPGQAPIGENQLIPRCLMYLTYDQSFKINGDGNQSRDFIHVQDVALTNVFVAESQVLGTYNVSTGVSTSVVAICSQLRHLLGRVGKGKANPSGEEFVWPKGPPVKEPKVQRLSNAKITQAGWWEPRPVRLGLEDTVDWWVARMLPGGQA